MDNIYLDNSATTRPSEKSIEKAIIMMKTKYGNPSSLHSMGLESELEIEEARDQIAKSLSVNSKDIFFTSGGTEANNMVLRGVSEKQKRNGKRIISTPVEHSSIMDTLKMLESNGYEVVYLSLDEKGQISLDELKSLVDDNTILVTCMAVNNEIGTIFPIDKISKIVKNKNKDTLIHVDAVQAFGKMKLTPSKWSIDFMTVSAHKVHAPKNVGAIYISNVSKLNPLIYGGEQQKKVRPGTEMSSLIPSFGVAVSEFNIDKNYKYVNELNQYLRDKISDIEGIEINSSDDALPYILNISVEGIRSETMLHFLESKGVFVSSGSACAKGKKSYVLTSLGLDNNRIDSAIRISFSKYNKKEELDILVDGIKEAMERLSKR